MSKLADSKSLVSTDPTRVPYKVLAFDLLALGKRKEAEELASLGRKEIQLAEDEMPGLMALRARYGKSKPLAAAGFLATFSRPKTLLLQQWLSVVEVLSIVQSALQSLHGRAKPSQNIGGARRKRSCGQMVPART